LLNSNISTRRFHNTANFGPLTAEIGCVKSAYGGMLLLNTCINNQQSCVNCLNNLECGPIPKAMAILPNIGGALCSTPQSWLTLTTTMRCSNAAKTQNPLKFAGVRQTNEPISAVGEPKVTVLSGHAEEILYKFFFPIVDTCVSCEDRARQSCAMVQRWRFFCEYLRPGYSAIRVQHVSDLHSKFAVRSHHVCKYGNLQRLRLGEEKRKEERRR